jgi:hypothetical protein
MISAQKNRVHELLEYGSELPYIYLVNFQSRYKVSALFLKVGFNFWSSFGELMFHDILSEKI